MGGNALKKFGINTVRKTTEELYDIIDEINPKLKTICKDTFPSRFYRNKKDHGDLDILVHGVEKETILDFIHNVFLPNGVFVNDNIISFDYDNFQIDVILIESKYWEISKVYFSYDPAPNLIGKLFYGFGMTYGDKGLYYRFETKHKVEYVYLTNDPRKIFSFVGLDYDVFNSGFDDLEDIFDFIISSKFFDKELFDYENLKGRDRKRNRKRETYRGFLKYASNKESKFHFGKNKKLYIDYIIEWFPFLYEKIDKKVGDIESYNMVKDKFRNIISLYKPNKKFGDIVSLYKRSKNNFTEFLSENMEEEISKDFSNFYKNYMELDRMVSQEYGVGKKMGNDIYVHKSAEDVIPYKYLDKSKHLLPNFDYDIVKYNKVDHSISFIKSNNWDDYDEPVVDDSYKVSIDGNVKYRPKPKRDQIYHHKWMFVRPDYNGFDYYESKLRSLKWYKNYDYDYRKIGYKDYWDNLSLNESSKHEMNNVNVGDIFISKKTGFKYECIKVWYSGVELISIGNKDNSFPCLYKRLNSDFYKKVNEEITDEETRIMNSTSRTNKEGKGSVGYRAVVPTFVEMIACKKDLILDYGAGKYPLHAFRLKEKGYNVKSYDFGNNFDPTLHDKDALQHKYDVIYASNVLNVQLSEEIMRETIEEIKSLMKPQSIFIANYPRKPRKNDIDFRRVKKILSDYFEVTVLSSKKLVLQMRLRNDNRIVKENFEPEEHWEENDYSIDEYLDVEDLVKGEIYTIDTKISKIILKFNKYMKKNSGVFIISTPALKIYYMMNGVEFYYIFNMYKLNHKIRKATLEEMNKLIMVSKKKGNELKESFEPEEYWESEDHIEENILSINDLRKNEIYVLNDKYIFKTIKVESSPIKKSRWLIYGYVLRLEDHKSLSIIAYDEGDELRYPTDEERKLFKKWTNIRYGGVYNQIFNESNGNLINDYESFKMVVKDYDITKNNKNVESYRNGYREIGWDRLYGNRKDISTNRYIKPYEKNNFL